MTIHEFCDRIRGFSQCVDALTMLKQCMHCHTIPLSVIEGQLTELIRAEHDTAREFEAECIRRGRNNLAGEIAKREPIFTK